MEPSHEKDKRYYYWVISLGILPCVYNKNYHISPSPLKKQNNLDFILDLNKKSHSPQPSLVFFVVSCHKNRLVVVTPMRKWTIKNRITSISLRQRTIFFYVHQRKCVLSIIIAVIAHSCVLILIHKLSFCSTNHVWSWWAHGWCFLCAKGTHFPYHIFRQSASTSVPVCVCVHVYVLGVNGCVKHHMCAVCVCDARGGEF